MRSGGVRTKTSSKGTSVDFSIDEGSQFLWVTPQTGLDPYSTADTPALEVGARIKGKNRAGATTCLRQQLSSQLWRQSKLCGGAWSWEVSQALRR